MIKWTKTDGAPRMLFPGAPSSVLTEHNGIVVHARPCVKPLTLLDQLENFMRGMGRPAPEKGRHL